MTRLTPLFLVLLFVAGCSVLQRTQEYHAIGRNTPLEAGEASPESMAAALTDAISVIPGAAPIVPFFTPLLVGLIRIRRGYRLQTGTPASDAPAISSVLRGVSAYNTAMFELGADGSGLKRGWKVAASVLLALGSAALLFEPVRAFVIETPAFAGAVALLAGIFGGFSKQLDTVTAEVAATPVGDPT